MNHQTLTPKQKEWIGWIIKEQWKWLKANVNAERNHQRLNWSYETGLYDVSTKELLNYILKEFNEHETIKYQWELKRQADRLKKIKR